MGAGGKGAWGPVALGAALLLALAGSASAEPAEQARGQAGPVQGPPEWAPPPAPDAETPARAPEADTAFPSALGRADATPGSRGRTAPPTTLDRLDTESVPGQLLVRFRPGANRAGALKRVSGTLKRELRVPGVALVQLPAAASARAAARTLAGHPDVVYAEPNYLRQPSVVPNDTHLPALWGLNDPVGDFDVDGPEAWDIQTGSSSVVVAVVDTGVESRHPDLAGNMWTNPGEIAGNGLDDDANGLVDDAAGFDFFDGDGVPRDVNGHGTHVAGTIAAQGNDGYGVVGVAWDASIMPLRVCGGGGCPDSAIADAFAYAGAMGADVANASLGGPGFSQTILDAINGSPNTLFVVAAGNSGVDVDVSPSYPCAYPDGATATTNTAGNIVCVAALAQSGALASFSNYGSTGVDLAARGVGILSSVPTFDPVARDGFEVAGTFTTGGVGTTWGRTSAIAAVGSFSLTDSPSGNYANNRNTWARVGPFDLTGRSDCRLSYLMRLETENGPVLYDAVWIELSSNGTTWTTVAGWAGSTGGSFFLFEDDLSLVAGSATAFVRFRLETNSAITFDGVHLDELAVECVEGTFDESSFDMFSGTSMASPHVAGAAALLFAQAPALTVAQAKTILLESTEPTPSAVGVTVTGGRVNAFNAVRSFCNGVPATKVGTDLSETLSGSPAADVIVGLGGDDTLQGLGGNDTICGGDGSDRLYGHDGADTIYGGGGADRLEGGNGDDPLLDGGPGDNRIEGGPGADTLVGGSGNERLLGGDGADSLSGNDGNDVLQGGPGVDVLMGGLGLDVGDYMPGVAANVNLTAGAASADGHGTSDASISGVEVLWGGTGPDVFIGDEGPNALYGGPGPDTVDGRGGDDTVEGQAGDDVSLAGGPGNDVIRGGDGNDALWGGDGNDALYGNLGADSGDGGAGSDRVDGGDGDDGLLDGGPGNDTVTGGPGSDTLTGGLDDDRIEGGEGDDPSLSGGGGNDWVLGQAGADVLFGGDGDDILVGGAGSDTLNGGAGLDIASYTDAPAFAAVSLLLGTASADGWGGSDPSIAQVEGLWGTAFSDTLSGDDGPNLILAGAGDDQLFGHAGADRLDGGSGTDTIDGGADADICLSGEILVSCP